MKKVFKRGYRLITIAVVVSLLLVLMPAGSVMAAAVDVTDTLSTYAKNTSANHEIGWTQSTAWIADGTIVVTFADDFTLTGVVYTDIDLYIGEEKTLVDTPATGSITCAVSGQTVTFTPFSTELLHASAAAVVIEIGTNADSGGNQITNPATTAAYTIGVVSGGDSGNIAVHIGYLGLSDTLSGTDAYYKAAAYNKHTVVFTNIGAIVASGLIVITPEDLDFTIPTMDYADITLTVEGETRTLAGAASGSADGVSVTTGTSGNIDITLGTTTTNTKAAPGTSGNIAAGCTIVITIGDGASAGLDDITNPSAANAYTVGVDIKNAVPTTVHTSTAKVRIIDGLAQDLYAAKDTISGFNATRLTADVAAGGTVLSVEDTTGILANDRLLLRQGDTQDEIVVVSSIVESAKTITVSSGVLNSWDANDVIEVLELTDIGHVITFTNTTNLVSELETVEVIFGGDFTADHGDVINATMTLTGSLDVGSGSMVVTDARTLTYTYTSGQNLSADQSCTITLANDADEATEAWMFGDLTADGPLTSNEYPVTVNLLDTDGDVVDTVTMLITIDEVTNIQVNVPETLTYAMGSVTEPTGGTIHTGASITFVDFGTLVDGQYKEAVLEIEVDTNATHGYVVNVIGDATLKSVTDPSNDTIAAVSGSNASPDATWTTVESSTTSAYGYHSSDEALLTGTPGRFSSATTYAAFSTASVVADNAVPVNGAHVDSDTDAEGHHEITIKIEIDTLHPAGTYQGTITFIVTPSF